MNTVSPISNTTGALTSNLVKYTFLILFFPCILFSQGHFFNAINGSDTLGTFHVYKTHQSDTVFISSKADLAFSIFPFGKIAYMAKSHSSFADGHLNEYRMVGKVRDKTPTATILKAPNGYQVDINTRSVQKKHLLQKPIRDTFMQLYFAEPMDLDSIFSENTGEFIAIKKESVGIYSLEINGNSWRLFYQKGELVEAEFDGFFDYTLVLDRAKSNGKSD